MNDQERNYYNAFVRVRDFGVENDNVIKDFPTAVTNFTAIGTGIDAIEASGEVQSSGAISQGVVSKAFVLDDLREIMRRINRTARAIAVDDPSVAALFRMPQGSNEQQMLAAARAFASNALPIQQQFVDYGMNANFITDLQTSIESYEQAITQKNVALDEGIGATANIGVTVKNTLNALRRLRGIIPNIFVNDVAKLAAWKSASHVERMPKKKAPETPPTT